MPSAAVRIANGIALPNAAHQPTWRRIGWSIPDVLGMRSPHSEDVLGRQAKEDLADSFVVQDPSLSLLRDRVDVTQPSLERIFLEHRH
jgi:hypothetical protein